MTHSKPAAAGTLSARPPLDFDLTASLRSALAAHREGRTPAATGRTAPLTAAEGVSRVAEAVTAQPLGSTGIGFSVVNPAGRDKRQNSREDRFALRAKVRRYADRTMVPLTRWEEQFNLETGETRRVKVERTTIDPGNGQEYVLTGPRDDKYLGCGRRIRSSGGPVGIAFDGETAGATNLQSCGSAWVCPVCSAKIQAHRAAELGQVLAWARAEMYTLAMVTLTVRHTKRDSLENVWDSVSDGWHAVTGGVGAGYWGSEKPEKYLERLERWEEQRQLAIDGKGRYPRGGRAGIKPQRRIGDAERFGVMGWARAVEVTVGVNGWHVHVHAVVILAGDVAEAKHNALELGAAMFDRWSAGLAKTGFTAVKHKGGLHVSVTDAAEKRLAEYLTKDQGSTPTDREREAAAKMKASHGKKARKLALEATLGDAKSGRRGGKTPFQLLDSIDPSDPGQQLAQWREFVEASAGRLALTWSAGLRELAKLEAVEKADDAIAAEAPGGVVVLELDADDYLSIGDRVTELFSAIEDGDVAAGVAWLKKRGLRYEIPKSPEDDSH